MSHSKHCQFWIFFYSFSIFCWLIFHLSVHCFHQNNAFEHRLYSTFIHLAERKKMVKYQKAKVNSEVHTHTQRARHTWANLLKMFLNHYFLFCPKRKRFMSHKLLNCQTNVTLSIVNHASIHRIPWIVWSNSSRWIPTALKYVRNNNKLVWVKYTAERSHTVNAFVYLSGEESCLNWHLFGECK